MNSMKIKKGIKRQLNKWSNRVMVIAALFIVCTCPYYCNNAVFSKYRGKENKELEKFNAKEIVEIINIEKTWGPPPVYGEEFKYSAVKIDYAFCFNDLTNEKSVYLQRLAVSLELKRFIETGMGDVYAYFDSLDLSKQVLVVE